MRYINKNINFEGSNIALLFLPGIFLVAVGVVAVLAPRLLIAVLAGLCISVGVVFCYLAWKFLQFKRKVENAVNQFQGRIFVQGVSVDPMEEIFEALDDEKKFTYH
ncbi:MAG: hypothetical protein D6719_06750 [Candidatus Dadabacteria bacterium]|nr:MAG: hypothetical protein D6719_06750 [Candidatus Dadabacteria bacterium]